MTYTVSEISMIITEAIAEIAEDASEATKAYLQEQVCRPYLAETVAFSVNNKNAHIATMVENIHAARAVL